MPEGLPKDCVCGHTLVAWGIHQYVDVVQNPRMSVLYASDVHVEHLELSSAEATEFD